MKTRTLLLAGVAALFLATGAAHASDAELPDRWSHHQDRVSLGEGHGERYAQIAAEFVRLNVDVIVTTGPAALQAKKATSVIPIVLALSGDLVGAGLVASLARPGGATWLRGPRWSSVRSSCKVSSRLSASGLCLIRA